MRIAIIAAAALWLAAAPGAQAQVKNAAPPSVPEPSLLKDGAFRCNGIMMRLRAGQMSQLSAPLILENGAVVRLSSLIVGHNGSRQLLPEGHAVTMQGDVVQLRDDMLTPRAIDEHAKAITGSTGAAGFGIPDSLAAAGRGGLSPRLTAKLLRTEQRLVLLEEMSAKLERRTQVKSPAAASLDQQLSQLNVELRQLPSAASPLANTPAAGNPTPRQVHEAVFLMN